MPGKQPLTLSWHTTHIYDYRCAICGSPFQTGRANSRYCSSACRQEAQTRRRHEKANQDAQPTDQDDRPIVTVN